MTIADLRRARTARGLSLSDVSESTRIGTFYLQKIEEGKLSALPPGLYARSFLRSYAGAVGLDPNAVIGLLPDELVPPSAQGAGAAGGADGAPVETAGSDSRIDTLKQLLARYRSGAEVQESTSRGVQESTSRGQAMLLRPRRLMATLFDGLLLAAIHVAILLATSAVGGVSLKTLLGGPGLGVVPLLILITAMYVLLLGGMAGQTIGAMVFGVPAARPQASTPDVPTILQRPLTTVASDGLTTRLMSSMAELFRRQRHHA
jgi:uncharacterized RDD family membrane protein YckC